MTDGEKTCGTHLGLPGCSREFCFSFGGRKIKNFGFNVFISNCLDRD